MLDQHVDELLHGQRIGSGMTCWRRLRDWQLDGAWARIHAVLLDRLDWAGRIDWSRAATTTERPRSRTRKNWLKAWKGRGNKPNRATSASTFRGQR